MDDTQLDWLPVGLQVTPSPVGLESFSEVEMLCIAGWSQSVRPFPPFPTGSVEASPPELGATMELEAGCDLSCVAAHWHWQCGRPGTVALAQRRSVTM